MKLMGLVALFTVPTLLGLYLSQRGRFRLGDLRQIKSALAILYGEISFAATPLPEAAVQVSRRVEAPVADLFAAFGELLNAGAGLCAADAWEQSYARHRHRFFFEKEDDDSLRSFGKTLGYLDQAMQMNTIQSTLERLSEREALLVEKQQKEGKLYRSLGLLGGLLLVVLMF